MSRWCLDTSAHSHFLRGTGEVVDLRRSGTPVPTNDVWIAATAARHGVLVLTYDAHFRAIGGAGSRILQG